MSKAFQFKLQCQLHIDAQYNLQQKICPSYECVYFFGKTSKLVKKEEEDMGICSNVVSDDHGICSKQAQMYITGGSGEHQISSGGG